jgi:hypothetical protein
MSDKGKVPTNTKEVSQTEKPEDEPEVVKFSPEEEAVSTD